MRYVFGKCILSRNQKNEKLLRSDEENEPHFEPQPKNEKLSWMISYLFLVGYHDICGTPEGHLTVVGSRFSDR